MRWSVFCAALMFANACWHAPAQRETRREAVGPKPAPLSPDQALSRIEKLYRPGVERCYKSQLKQDPTVHGRVTLTFTVDPAGRLSAREARGVHPAIERCVEAAMASWTFPQPADETTYRLGMELTPTP
jgi:hypothetical protein